MGLISRIMLWTPGARRRPPKPTPPAVLRELGVNCELRIDVGPPAASLAAWVIEPTSAAPRGVIVMLHGIHDNKRRFLHAAKPLAAAGYRVVLVDLRSHGDSTGGLLTFGVRDACDLKQLADQLESRGLLNAPLGAFGTSYGGAAAMQWAACDDRLAAVISVCAFTRLHDVVPLYVRRLAPVVHRLWSDASIGREIERAAGRAGFDAAACDNVAAAQHTDAALLVIHGREDRKVPISHAQRIHAAARGSARLMLIDNHGHDSIIRDSDALLTDACRDWFDIHLTNAAEPAGRESHAAVQSV